MKLRLYQQKYVDNFKVGVSNLLRADCRSGKSLILERIVDKYFSASRVLVISSRTEVLNELSRYFPSHTRIQGSYKYDQSKLVTLATPQTLTRRDIDYSIYECIAVDEIHEAKSMKAVKKIREEYRGTFIGMTATPLDSKGRFIGGFDNILNFTSVPQMMREGYLAPTKFYSLGDLTNNISIKRGEYVEAEIEQAMSKKGLYEHVVKLNDTEYHWDTKHKTIIFASSIKAGTRMLEEFDRPSVKILHSNLSKKEYEETMTWFRSTDSCILVNCRILTTGFNEATVDTLIMLSPTAIKSLAMQTYFRSSTIDPNNPNKIARVYDFGGSLAKHSPFFDDWFNEGKKSCIEEVMAIADEEERHYAILGCEATPIVSVCNGELSSTYRDNPFVIDFQVTGKPCGEVLGIHDFKYVTTEDKNIKGIIYKWSKCTNCGTVTKVVLKTMTIPSDLIEIYKEDIDTNRVIALYSKSVKKVLLIIDDTKLVSYKFRFANSQQEIFDICRDVLKDKSFTLASNVNLNKLDNSNLNKDLDILVDMINWEDEDKNTGLIRKLVKHRVDSLAESYGYSRHYTYYFMKIVTNTNLKEIVKILENKPTKTDINRFKLGYEEQSKMMSKVKSPDLNIDEYTIPF